MPQVPFLKVVMMWPQHVTTARGCLEQGINLPVFGMRTFLTYESNVQFVMRYMVDTDIVRTPARIAFLLHAIAGVFPAPKPLSHSRGPRSRRWGPIGSRSLQART